MNCPFCHKPETIREPKTARTYEVIHFACGGDVVMIGQGEARHCVTGRLIKLKS